MNTGIISTVAYVNDGSQRILELDLLDGGQVRRNYVRTPTGELLAIDESPNQALTTTYWMFADANGSIGSVATVDASNNWQLQHRQFGTFGELTNRLGDQSTQLDNLPLIWRGAIQEQLPGALDNAYLMNGRWFDVNSARFLSEDPRGVHSGQSNLYVLDGNDPYADLNSTGFDWKKVEGPSPFSNSLSGYLGYGLYQGYNSPTEAGHLALDVIGMVPIFGIPADLANSAWYTAEGRFVEAGLSGAAAVPLFGYMAAGAQAGKYTFKAARYAGSAATALTGATTAAKTFKYATIADIGVNFAGAGFAIQQGLANGSALQVGLGVFGFGINTATLRNLDRIIPGTYHGSVGPVHSRMTELQAKYGHLTPAQRQARISQLSEANYGRRILDLEAMYGTPNVHSIEKHGAQTTFLSQFHRVQQLNYPNPTTGIAGNPTKNASRFLTNKDHYETLRYALNQQTSSFQSKVIVEFERNIGFNIVNLGTHSNRGPFSINLTNRAAVRFDPSTQRFFTAYPEP